MNELVKVLSGQVGDADAVLICDGMLFDKKSRLQLNFYYKFPF
jgi:hypothetical protein